MALQSQISSGLKQEKFGKKALEAYFNQKKKEGVLEEDPNSIVWT